MMNNWLEKPWVIRIVALALSVLLFVVVAFDENVSEEDVGIDSIFGTTNETRTLEDMPVNIEIDQEKYVVSGVPETAKVTLQGSVSLVTSTSLQRNFEVFVDLEGLGTGTHVVPLEYSGIANQLNVYVEPQEVEVSIEEKAAQEYTLNIDVLNRDLIAAGYEVGNVYADPETVTVTSSKSIVDRIAIVKAFVDVSNAEESFTTDDVPVKVYDNQGNELSVRIDPPTVDVTVDVRNPNKSVPISLETTNELADNLKVTSMELQTKEVTVFAAESYLDNLKELKTKPIDLSEIEESGTIEVELDLPQEVRKVSPATVNVTVEVEQTEERVMENIPVSIEGQPEDGSVSFVTPFSGAVNVTIRGFPSDIEALTAEDIPLEVVLDNQSPGEYTLPINHNISEEILENVEIELAIEEATILVEP
ncbi:YbbR domain-containing protein [Gracilibacillus ureilyticus]|uniref:YbbR domain-containing protein n=1 Tax=Gracilibacillus ureilyticus TaxID=531814 RepID=A0A1H9N877_9BACI|nr:CdaR family protein [Gracilibacillus ureilyticus]SER32186.1 YbbR domain-containing protein [Gracilibacillus ureilyticus]